MCRSGTHALFSAIWGVRCPQMLKMTCTTPPQLFKKIRLPVFLAILENRKVKKKPVKISGFSDYAENWYTGIFGISKTENDLSFSQKGLQSPVEAIGRFLQKPFFGSLTSLVILEKWLLASFNANVTIFI